jgi:hypothetical protein
MEAGENGTEMVQAYWKKGGGKGTEEYAARGNTGEKKQNMETST